MNRKRKDSERGNRKERKQRNIWARRTEKNKDRRDRKNIQHNTYTRNGNSLTYYVTRSSLRIRILSGLTAASGEDLGKKITRLVRIRNWLILRSLSQDLVQNFSRIRVSKSWKPMPVLIRILIRKLKNFAKIFTNYCLVHSTMSISCSNLF